MSYNVILFPPLIGADVYPIKLGPNTTFTQSKKVKVSRNRTGVAQRVPGGLGSQISRHSAHEGGEVVSLTHRPPLPPGTHFL
jgi:hypothetical protein